MLRLPGRREDEMDPELRAGIVRWAAWVGVLLVLALIIPPALFTVAPIGCVQCHADDLAVEEPVSTAHATTDCVACHVGAATSDRLRFGYYQAFGMVVPLVPTRDSSVSVVADSACVSCHDTFSPVTESRGLRVNHASCSEGSACVACHSTVAHGEALSWPTAYTMEMCLSCHGTREVARDCDLCHTGKVERVVPASGTFPVTHGPNWRQTHGMGDMATCAACHTTDDFCTACHGVGVPHTPRFLTLHPASALSEDSRCLSCHEQAFCDGCHVYEMPHPAKFTPEHSSIVARDGEVQCRMCHDSVDCVNCHDMHVHPGGAISGPPVGAGQR